MVFLRTLPEQILASGLICKADLKAVTDLVCSHLMRASFIEKIKKNRSKKNHLPHGQAEQ